MTATRVFVDDAVLGRLPAVCARTGVATSDHLVMTVPVGTSEGLGIAWLLILGGPIGWLGLFIYAMARRVETLTVQLPYCDTAHARSSPLSARRGATPACRPSSSAESRSPLPSRRRSPPVPSRPHSP